MSNILTDIGTRVGQELKADRSRITALEETTLAVSKGGTGTTTLTGIVKGNGTSAMTAAVAGTDYVIPSGSITGNAGTATKLTTARTITVSGDATSTAVPFDGSTNITLPLTLATINGGTY